MESYVVSASDVVLLEFGKKQVSGFQMLFPSSPARPITTTALQLACLRSHHGIAYKQLSDLGKVGASVGAAEAAVATRRAARCWPAKLS